MDDREQMRKEKLARRRVAEQLHRYFSALHLETDPEPLMDRVKQILEKEVQKPPLLPAN